ncbi:MAG TPA: isoprenylcysteine carboxylmethyltransferase family protein [Myxococcales bacterium]|nr:isoprenylcysteine carboxylmethyltransferase family protein [Myxococcales bacterium]
MNPRLAQWIDLGCWVVFCLTWLVAAARVKRDKRSEPLGMRFAQLLLYAAGAILLFDRPWFLANPTMWRLSLGPVARAWLSVAFTAAGIGLAIDARIVLGRNWSGRVTVKEGHELVVRGPYRLVRHPIYTGLLLAFLGTAILHAQAADFAGVAIFAFAYVAKLREEERFMQAEFGEAYASYRARVKALIPFVV